MMGEQAQEYGTQCTYCHAPFQTCACGVRTLYRTATIRSVPVEGSGAYRKAVEAALRETGILGPQEPMLTYTEERPFERLGSESFGAIFSVVVPGANGEPERRRVYAKAIIRGFSPEMTEHYVRQEVSRLGQLREWGIRTPKVYGNDRGTVYREWLDGDWAVLRQQLSSGTLAESEKLRYFTELARIAATLDYHGVQATNFLNDLGTDPAGNVYFIDAGEDLGPLPETPPAPPVEKSRHVLRTLTARPDDVEILDNLYETCYTSLRQKEVGVEKKERRENARPAEA